ncbi:hypothetical protein D3C85_1227580 [compost metagenome]
MVNRRGNRQQDVDGRVQRAGEQFGLHLAAVEADRRNLHMRCHGRHTRHQRRQQRRFQRVAHADGEAARGGGGVEVRRILQRARERLQRAAHLARQRARQRRGRHALPAPLEQRIVEQRAKPPQRMADGGLRQVELTRGCGDAAFAVDGIEHHEEVQVDPG